MADREFELNESEYFEQIARNADEIAASAEKFNEEYERFWTRNLDQLGRILVAHLIVEHYLDAYIPAAYPGIKSEAIERLQFAKKLEIANLSGVLAHWTAGIRALNRIRNKLAHDLEASAAESDLCELRTPTEVWIRASGRTVDWSKDDVFREFSRWAAGFLNAETNGIRRHSDGLGRVAFERWVIKAVSTPRKKTDGPTVA